MLAAAEARTGRPAAARLLRTAGYLAAWRWCEQQASRHRLTGADLVRHYLSQLSLRGWGRFTVLDVDLAARQIDVRIDHSAFATSQPVPSGGGACYPFAGWLEGAVGYAADPGASPDVGREVTECQCVTTGADHCRFSSVSE